MMPHNHETYIEFSPIKKHSEKTIMRLKKKKAHIAVHLQMRKHSPGEDGSRKLSLQCKKAAANWKL